MSTTEQARGGRVSPSKIEVDEARALAREVGLEYVDLDRYPLNAAAASLLPEQVARRHHALAVGWKYGTPVVAVAAPDNVLGMDDVKTVVGRDVHAVVACTSQIDAYIERMYTQGGVARREAPAHRDKAPAATKAEATAQAAQAASAARAAEAASAAQAADAASAAQTAEATDAGSAAEATDAASAAETSAQAASAAEATDAASAAQAAEAATSPAAGATSGATQPQPQSQPEPQSQSQPEPRPEAQPEAVEGQDLSGPTPAAPPPPRTAAPPPPGDGAQPTQRDRHRGHPRGAGAAGADPEASSDGSEAGGQGGRQGGAQGGGIGTAGVGRDAIEPDRALAKVLVDSGQVTREEMQAALREASATGRKLGEILSELGLVTEEDLIRAMAEEAGLEFIDLNDFPIDLKAIQLLPETMAKRHQILAVGYRSGSPVIAMANPSNVFAMDDLRTVLGRDIVTVVSSPRQITDYISRMYRHDKEASDAATRAAASQTKLDTATERAELTDLHAVTDDAPIVKYVNLILRQALQERASDVHVEPSVDDLRIRFRIDGVLHDVTRSPKAIQGGVTTRLKVMADLDIAEHRIPQDGRISLNAGTREVDLRVATLPTVHGEKVVMRILDKSNAMLDLGDLGFLPEVQRRYKESYRKPYGTILVTGPTGSGKSTTLYATLNDLNSPERNLITVEDPVEYQLPGVNQVQVNNKAGLTFAGALRSILRSDPDIILVGEIRDRETAVIAIEAALTGHLVLSSLHTNDSAGTPMRLVEMGVEPFLVASSLDCVVAQRLARQLCENCNESFEPSAEDLKLFGWDDADTPPQGQARFRKPVGCQACSNTGYRGRIALHELLLMTEEIERAITHGSSADDIHRIAVDQGMIALRHDGLRKAALGLTSLEEVMRVVA
jgi:type IV pilus assembly protein PilB